MSAAVLSAVSQRIFVAAGFRALRTAHATALGTGKSQLVSSNRRRPNFPITSRRFALAVRVSAAQKWHFVENMLLEPFEPEVNHRRHKQRHQLGENQTAYNHQTQRAARCGILSEPGRNRREQYRDRMHVALVKDSEDNVHNEDGSEQQQRQSTK